MMPAMELRGPEISLRLPGPADAPALFALARDPEVTRWFSWGPYASVEEPERWRETVSAFLRRVDGPAASGASGA